MCLVIIFNHKFEKNLDILREMYRNRFSYVRFIMPFYCGNDEDVIPVYESSYQFQGYIAQAYEKLMQIECDDYFFIADDMILNPGIQENNIGEIEEYTNYMESYSPLPLAHTWKRYRIQDAIDCFSQRHTNYNGELFDRETAFAKANDLNYSESDFFVNWLSDYLCFNKLERFGWKIKKIFRIDFQHSWEHISLRKKLKIRFIWNNCRALKKEKLPYPLFFGYSDWMIITKKDFPSIARAFGVTAAMGLFVEVAVPTVMLLYSSHPLKSIKSLGFESGAIWDGNELAQIESNFQFELGKLIENYPPKKLYLHPIKLSKWRIR